MAGPWRPPVSSNTSYAAFLDSNALTVEIEAHLKSESVNRVRLDEPLAVEPGTPIRDVFELLKQHRTGGVLICRDTKLVGIFTERDALRLMAADANLDAPIQSVMVGDPVTVRQTDTVGTAVQKMAEGGYRRLPIIDDDHRPLGVITVRGIVHYLVEFFPGSVYNLPPVAQPMTQERDGA